MPSPGNSFTSWLFYGKPWGYPDYRHFLPPPFRAVPGITALFAQAWSIKLWIPHPHGTCMHQGSRRSWVPGRVLLNPDRNKNIIPHERHYVVRQSDQVIWWHFTGLCLAGTSDELDSICQDGHELLAAVTICWRAPLVALILQKHSHPWNLSLFFHVGKINLKVFYWTCYWYRPT